MKIINGTDIAQMKTAAMHYMSGYPVILPTDTNYNLACNPISKEAIERVYKIKQRDKCKPLSLFLLKPEEWERYCIPCNMNIMEILVKEYWPGPLNIVVKKRGDIYHEMTNGNDTIAIGCIRNQVWRQFLKICGGDPVALTSANVSGMAEGLVTEDIARKQMEGKVKYLIRSTIDITESSSSTIIRVEEEGISILRQGGIGKRMLQKTLSKGGYYVS